MKKYTYFILFILLVVVSATHFFFSPSVYIALSTLPGGLVTEICGILVTLIFVERILEIAEKKKEKKILSVATLRISRALDTHLEFLARLGNLSGEDKFEDYRTYFSAEYWQKISKIDVTDYLNYFPPQQVFDVFRQSLYSFRSSILSVLDCYIPYLPAKHIDLLEKAVQSSNFFPPREVLIVPQTHNIFQQGILEDFRKYIDLLLNILKEIDSSSLEKKVQIGSSVFYKIPPKLNLTHSKK